MSEEMTHVYLGPDPEFHNRRCTVAERGHSLTKTCIILECGTTMLFDNLAITNQPLYDWKVGDECWICNDEGHSISDDSFEYIGDDLELKIMSLYDSNGLPMAVVHRGSRGVCFRVDMLRPVKSNRDKDICKLLVDFGYNTDIMVAVIHEAFGKLYDAGLLKDGK